MCKKFYIRNPATCSWVNGKYLGYIIDDSLITCEKIIEETKNVLEKTVQTKCTSTNFYIVLAFLLIIIALLIVVIIYCYFTKYQAKQKPLLPYCHIIRKLKETGY